MDSVNFGIAERQTTELTLKLDDKDRPITVAELLSWVESFASEEGPQLIEDAGKDGIVALRFTLARLLSLTTQAHEISKKDTGNPTRGFHSLRAQRGLEEVKLHLTAAAGRANKLDRSVIRLQEQIDPDPGKVALGPVPPAPAAAPVIFGIDPAKREKLEEGSPPNQDTFEAVVHGANFNDSAGVRIGRSDDQIRVSKKTVKSAREIVIELTIEQDAPAKSYDITVINPDGKKDVRKAGFELVESLPSSLPPEIELRGISPAEGFQNSSILDFKVNGFGFSEGAVLTVGDLPAVKDVVVQPTFITGRLDIPEDAGVGDYDVIVRINGERRTLENAFEVKPKATEPCPTHLTRIPTSVVSVHSTYAVLLDERDERVAIATLLKPPASAIPGYRETATESIFVFDISNVSEGSILHLSVIYENGESELFLNAVRVKDS